MEPTVKASLLWGVVSVLSFLVGVQTYVLLGGAFFGVGTVIGVAAGVGIVSAGLTHLIRPKLRQRSRQ
ncbi:hypothetical protein [Halobacteriaceae bacterium SHR40]|uniref:hypothetical protein n=1 Tax=Halovenus amylolytica TaxID=2500550 RepID=UPI000FE40DE2